VIDISRALDLLEMAAKERGEDFVFPPVPISDQTCLYATRDGPQCIVGHALSLADVGPGQLEPMRAHGIRELYRQGRLPVTLTLGALAVLDAAQHSQDRGYAWGDVLDYAADAAVRFLDLLPDVAFDVAANDRITPA
jgi:hypothetical protein